MLILRFVIEPLQKCFEVHSKVLNVCCIMRHVSAGVCVGAAWPRCFFFRFCDGRFRALAFKRLRFVYLFFSFTLLYVVNKNTFYWANLLPISFESWVTSSAVAAIKDTKSVFWLIVLFHISLLHLFIFCEFGILSQAGISWTTFQVFLKSWQLVDSLTWNVYILHSYIIVL